MLQKGIEFTDEVLGKACIWNQLGDAYRKLADHENAVISYRKAIELSPQNPVFQINLAEIEPSSQVVYSDSTLEKDEDTFQPPAMDASNETSPGNRIFVMVEPSLLDTGHVEGEQSNAALTSHPETAGRSTSGSACWVYKDGETANPVKQNPLVEPEESPMILGSRILSDYRNGRGWLRRASLFGRYQCA